MTQAMFFGFLRSGFRALSVRWKPKNEALKDARRAYVGPKKLQKWEYQCAACKQWFKAKEVELDHISPTGGLKDWNDVVTFLKRLFVEKEGYQVLCITCHRDKTNREAKK